MPEGPPQLTKPIDIRFPTSSAPGRRPQESGGRLINCFTEKTPQGAPSSDARFRSPGLPRVLNTSPSVHTRGFLDTGNICLWILNDHVVSFDGTTATDLGTLVGSDSVTLARNNAAPNQFVVVTSQGCFNLFTASAPTPFADLDLPANPTSVCDYNGYFVWTFGDGRVFASDLNSTNVNALSFNTEQGLFARRAVRYSGRLYILGDKWTGVYHDAGTIPFPFAREVTIPRGIVGTHAIAGWEAGWANQLLWVGDDFIVYRLDGYTPTAVSNDDVSRAIQAAVLAGRGDEIEAYVYMYGKNAFWAMTCSNLFTWEFNITTGEWNERMSYNRKSWKGFKSIRMFDQWLIGDFYTGELYTVSGTYFLEGIDPLVMQVDSGVLHSFPRGIVVPRASFHITTGVGTVSSVIDPLVEISWSMDGGYSFGEPVIRRLGGPGRTKSHPYILSCGLSRGQGIRFRIKVSDPVHVGLSGGVIEADQRTFSG